MLWSGMQDLNIVSMTASKHLQEFSRNVRLFSGAPAASSPSR